MTEVHDQENCHQCGTFLKVPVGSTLGKNWNEEVPAMYAFPQMPTNQPPLERTHL